MAKSKKRAAKRAHNPKTNNIPANARYINVTTLDDDLLTRVCKLSESKVVNNVYLVFGILAIVAGALLFLLLHGDPATCVIIAAFGVLFLYQRSQLSRRTAKNLGREMDRSGEGARTRTLFFTPDEVGTVDDDGSAHTFPYSSVESVYEDDRMFALILHDDAGVVTVSKAGFKHGSAEDFGEMVRRRVDEANEQFQSELRKRGAAKRKK